MEENTEDLTNEKIYYKININFSNNKIINNSNIIINKKCISEKKTLHRTPKNEMYINSKQKKYDNNINKKITFEPKNKIKNKVLRKIYPKSREKRLTIPSSKSNYNLENFHKKNKVIKNVSSKKELKTKLNESNKKIKSISSSEKNFTILDKKLPKSKRNKAIILSDSQKIKLKTEEKRLNTEKMKKNKKFISDNMIKKENTDKNIKKDSLKISNQETNNYSKNYFINNWNLILRNITTKVQTPNSKKNNNSSHRKNVKLKKNMTPNNKSNRKIILEKKSKREFISDKNKNSKNKNKITNIKNNIKNIKNDKNNNKSNISNNKNDITNNKSNSSNNKSNNSNNKLLEFGENGKNERINRVKINNFNINKPKEQNLKFIFTKNQKEKDSEISFSGASKIIIGKIDAYNDIIERDQKNDKNVEEINDSFTFNENEFKEKNNYDYNNDSNYLNSYKKTGNNKSFCSISFTINTENNIKNFAQKVSYNIINQSELEKNKEIETETNKDNCIII